MDPIANLAGYAIGHVVSVDFSSIRVLSTRTTTVLASSGIALLLSLNRPSMIPTFSIMQKGGMPL